MTELVSVRIDQSTRTGKKLMAVFNLDNGRTHAPCTLVARDRETIHGTVI